MRAHLVLVACGVWLAAGCNFNLGQQRRQAGPMSDEDSEAVRSLRIHLRETAKLKIEGDVAPGFDVKLRTLIGTELERNGVTLAAKPGDAHDLVLTLEGRVHGAPIFFFGRVSLAVKRGEQTVDVLTADDELHPKADFAGRVAWVLAHGFLESRPVAAAARELTSKRRPGPRAPGGAILAVDRTSSAGAATAAGPTPAEKPSAGAIAQAKERSRRGQSLYDLGRYKEAVDEYEAAYLAAPDAVLLYNLGQCHRKLGNGKEAAMSYRGYLRNHPQAPNRKQVERFIAELEAAPDS